MNVQMFNIWYWFWLFLSFGFTIGLYFILRKRSQKTIKIVLFSILILGLVAHFTKFLYPPYSTDNSKWLRDSWFINICAGNIALFPFFFASKSDRAKDYMFYLGMIGGLFAVLYPLEPMQKANQMAEWIDIVRFYFHHTMLYAVPLLMVVLKVHKLSYKRVAWCPVYFLGVLLFIMLNQVLQSELGFVPLRDGDIINVNYKNSSFIWGPGQEDFAVLFTAVCPKIFKTIPVGEHAGEAKYWPWFWLIVPAFVYLVPISFLMCMIFDHKNFKADMTMLIGKTKAYFLSKKQNKNQKDSLKTETIQEAKKDDKIEIRPAVANSNKQNVRQNTLKG